LTVAWGLKMRDMKNGTVENAVRENAGHEKSEPNCGVENARHENTGKKKRVHE